MCIIAVKHSGTQLDWNRLQDCFEANPDGAGFAYAVDEGIYISKGFMEFESLRSAVATARIRTEHEVLFHFRIATHGQVIPANTHPFPLSSDRAELDALDVITPMAIAHNGIVSGVAIPDKTMSDTMAFITSYLAPMGVKAVANPTNHPLIQLASQSKLAIMTTEGIGLIGTFEQVDGWSYSNQSYEADYKEWVRQWEADQELKHLDAWAYCDGCGGDVVGMGVVGVGGELTCDDCAVTK
jgi:hypothetical protein